MRAKRTAFCGVLAALALIFLFAAAMVPSGKLGLTAVAGIFPALAVVAGGLKWGLLTWAASGVLGLILLPDRFPALLFLLALGLYPVLKSPMEHRRHRAAEWALKFLFFDLVLTVFFGLFRAVFLTMLPPVLSGALPLYLCGNVVFLLYDLGLSRLLTVCAVPIRKSLHKR